VEAVVVVELQHLIPMELVEVLEAIVLLVMDLLLYKDAH
jgi:hypothetical protein